MGLLSEKALNDRVAITVVLLSVVAGIAGIKDSNITEEMQQVQATSIDLWNEGQAARTRLHVAEAGRDQIEALAPDPARTKPLLAELDRDIARHAAEARRLADQARIQTARYDTLDLRDSQFDISNAAIAVAISIAGVASLAESVALLYVAWLVGAFGLFMALAGFASWGVHIHFLAGLLG